MGSKKEQETEENLLTYEKQERETWTNKTEYVLALVGNAVGIGNIWRFPYQCQKYGGGNFIIVCINIMHVSM